MKLFKQRTVLLVETIKSTVEKTDRKLIKETLRGKLKSYEVIVRRYQKQIYHHTLRILNDHFAAEDATQEAFVRAFENLRKFDIEKPFKPWIYKISTNFCLDYIRKNKNILPLEDYAPDIKESIFEKIIRWEEIKSLRHAIERLPEIYRQPIIGYYFFGLNYQMLSNEFRLPVNTLKTRVRRGKFILARELI